MRRTGTEWGAVAALIETTQRRRSGTLLPMRGESRWRRSQRRRRRRLTGRGRATLALAGLLVAGGLAAWAGSLASPEADPSPLPPVAAAAPPPDMAPAPPPAVLGLLPASRRALRLPAAAPGIDAGPAPDVAEGGRLYERITVPGAGPRTSGPLRVEYTLDAELTRRVFRILQKARVGLGHVIVLDPGTGRVLTYASTDVAKFPPTRTYPAASLVKVITAATALARDPSVARLPCRFRGSPYRLTRSRIDPPRTGTTVSLRRALATSNNQCFAQLAVHAVGPEPLREAIARFGWLSPPAAAHAAGTVDLGEDRYDLARAGSGLAGCRITPLHAAQLATVLAHGELIAPHWIERVFDARGRELPLPAMTAPRRVLTPTLARELRTMLVDTTERGTARSAFRGARGRPLLGAVRVAGKTGSLSGSEPRGRYEWFVGVAPVERPRIAVAVLLVQGDLWWRSASQIAAEVLRTVFCSDGPCRAAGAERWTHPGGGVPPAPLAGFEAAG
jgi:peptidoglycan glycosyltransferase